jgi:hypothetical protein
MKLILTALSWLFLIKGILLFLSLAILVWLPVFYRELNLFSVIMIVMAFSALALSVGFIFGSINFLRKKGEKEAYRIATLTGFFVWITVNSMTIKLADPAEEFETVAAFGLIFLLPILLGIISTRVIKILTRKAYDPNSEPGGIVNDEAAPHRD